MHDPTAPRENSGPGEDSALEQLARRLAALNPLDEANRRLAAHVHPPNWKNPTPRGRYNLVVLGSGTAGLVAAVGAAGLGARVALVERNLMGGDCLNVGCVPSKALLRCARAVASVRNAAQFGVQVPEGVAVDFPAVMQRMRRLRSQLSPHDSARRLADLGVDVYFGHGRFTDRQTIEVEGTPLKFSRACIATGSRAAMPPIPGLAEAGCLTNETVFSLTELPQRLAVIGAGPLGCELAQAFARFGSSVWLIETQHGVMPREDRDAAEIVQRSLERDGVQILCCGTSLQVTASPHGKTLSIESHGRKTELQIDAILVGAGRTPNVQGLGLEAAGVAFDEQSGVQVNDRLQTTNRRIYAAGDVCSPHKFTHVADAHARIVLQNALFFGRAKASALTIPWCTYTDPEVAHVGLSPAEAEKQGRKIRTFTIPLARVDRALLDGESEGLLKVHTRANSDKIVGATLVAAHAGDMISEITLAMAGDLGLSTLARTIHPYPTQAEAVKKAGDAYNRTRLTPRLQWLFEKWMAWRR